MEQIGKLIESVAFNLIKQAVIYLPEDVKTALREAYSNETSKVGKVQLKTILNNIALAEKHEVPICQDTGTLVFYVKAGAKFEDLDCVKEALLNATRKATVEIPLRPNAVNPFTQKNSGDNTGKHTPEIHWNIVSGDCLELILLTKGGGSENVSVLGMLNPSEGVNGLKRFVVDAVIEAGAKPCPPTILGVGIGGAADTALSLAKNTLLKPIDEPNNNPEIADLEQNILEAVNMTGIGPMGLGGKTTVLGVHIDYAYRHPASFPVAVTFNCWAARRASAVIDGNGAVEYLLNKKEQR